jgi:hypothetical protein
MISCAAQSETQNRPSHQRGDSPNMRPDIKVFTSGAEDFNDIDTSFGRLTAGVPPPCVFNGFSEDERDGRVPTRVKFFFKLAPLHTWVVGGGVSQCHFGAHAGL